jgi:hypothetical protein
MRYPSDEPGATNHARRASHRASPIQHRRTGSLRSRKAGATPEPLVPSKQPMEHRRRQPQPQPQPQPQLQPQPQQPEEAQAPVQQQQEGGTVMEAVQPTAAPWPGSVHGASQDTTDIGSDPAWWWPAGLQQRRQPAPAPLLVWEMRLSKEHGGRPYCALTHARLRTVSLASGTVLLN